ncbi:MAG: pyridoxamine 5'-phosphate oxidase family protein [Chitinivibrionales bacterium]|nr:pyridoxamine 5'-phosphate oxidase family protein [Chitinivibrionales bacterium]
MDMNELWKELALLADHAKTAVLATMDTKDRPHMRWVTPVILDDRFGSIYMVTSPEFTKVNHVLANPGIEWMFQTTSLDTIITVSGPMKICRNASLCSEVLELVSPRLRTFWKLNENPHEMVVLETIAAKAVFFKPVEGTKETITF